jgi:ribosomal protein L20
MEKKQVLINRKLLADLAVHNPHAFAEVVKFVSA